MANAKQCDICGEFYAAAKVADRRLGSYEFRDTDGVILIHANPTSTEEMETCPKCMEKIKEFVDGMKGE